MALDVNDTDNSSFRDEYDPASTTRIFYVKVGSTEAAYRKVYSNGETQALVIPEDKRAALGLVLDADGKWNG